MLNGVAPAREKPGSRETHVSPAAPGADALVQGAADESVIQSACAADIGAGDGVAGGLGVNFPAGQVAVGMKREGEDLPVTPAGLPLCGRREFPAEQGVGCRMVEDVG